MNSASRDNVVMEIKELIVESGENRRETLAGTTGRNNRAAAKMYLGTHG